MRRRKSITFCSYRHEPENPKLATGREIARAIALVYASPGFEAHAPWVMEEPYHTTGLRSSPKSFGSWKGARGGGGEREVRDRLCVEVHRFSHLNPNLNLRLMTCRRARSSARFQSLPFVHADTQARDAIVCW